MLYAMYNGKLLCSILYTCHLHCYFYRTVGSFSKIKCSFWQFWIVPYTKCQNILNFLHLFSRITSLIANVLNICWQYTINTNNAYSIEMYLIKYVYNLICNIEWLPLSFSLFSGWHLLAVCLVFISHWKLLIETDFPRKYNQKPTQWYIYF